MALTVGELVAYLDINDAAFIAKLDRDKAALTGMAAETQMTWSKAATAAGITGGVIAAAIGLSAKSYGNFALQSAKFQAQTSMTAEGASRLVGQFQMMFVKGNVTSMAMKTLEKSLYGLQYGEKVAADAYEHLGLTWQDLKDLKPEEQIALIRDRLSETVDPATRSGAATLILGRGAASMALWYSASATQIDKVNAALERNGQILNQDQLDAAKQSLIAWQNLVGAFKGLEYAIGKAVIPQLTNLAKALAVVFNILRPFAGVLWPVATALIAFAVAVKGAIFVQTTWGQAAALMGRGIVSTTTSLALETTALEAETLALKANAAALATRGSAAAAGATIHTMPIVPFTGFGLAGMALMSAGGAGVEVRNLPDQMVRDLEKAEPELKSAIKSFQDIMAGINDVQPGAEGEKALEDYMNQLRKLRDQFPGTQLAKDIQALLDQVNKTKPAFEEASAAAIAWAKVIGDIINVQIPGMSGPIAMTKGQAVLSGWMDQAGNMLKGATLVEDIKKTAQETAAAGADLALKLASIPKNIKQVLNRDWVGIGAAFQKAMLEFNQGMSAGMSDALVAAYATRVSNLASIASSLGTVLKSLSDAPKKVISPTRQNWTALGQALLVGVYEILAVFSSLDDKMLDTEGTRMGSIGSMAGGLGSFIGALSKMPKKAVSPTKQAWTSLANVLRVSIAEVLAVFNDSKNKDLAKQATRAGSVGSMAGGLGSFIDALSSMPKKATKVIPQAWTSLAQVLSAALALVLKVFESPTAKQLASTATRMGSVGSMAGGLGSFISALSSMPDHAVSVIPQKWQALARVIEAAVTEVLTAFKEATTKQLGDTTTRAGDVGSIAGALGSIIDFFVSAPTEAVTVVPQKWHALASAIRSAITEVMEVFVTVADKLLGTQADRMGKIATLAGALGDILSFFANAPASVLSVTEQNWTAFGAALATAIDNILSQFDRWDDKALEKLSTRSGFISTMVQLVQDIANLAASLPDLTSNLQEFSRMSLSFGDMWTNIGNALAQMIDAIAGALDHLPGMTRMKEAQEAISTLSDIFSSMSAISQSLYSGGYTTPTVPLPTTATNNSSGAPALSGAGGDTYIVQWSTFTSTPSAREANELVDLLEPILTKRKVRKAGSAF